MIDNNNSQTSNPSALLFTYSANNDHPALSRPVMFQRFYWQAMNALAPKTGRLSPSHRGWVWTSGATRQRARKLAREQARLAMKLHRQQERERVKREKLVQALRYSYSLASEATIIYCP